MATSIKTIPFLIKKTVYSNALDLNFELQLKYAESWLIGLKYSYISNGLMFKYTNVYYIDPSGNPMSGRTGGYSRSPFLSLNIQKQIFNKRLAIIKSNELSMEYYVGILGGYCSILNYGFTSDYQLVDVLRTNFSPEMKAYTKLVNTGSGVVGLQTSAWFRLKGFSLFQLSLRYQYTMNTITRSKIIMIDPIYNNNDELVFNRGRHNWNVSLGIPIKIYSNTKRLKKKGLID